MVTGHQLVDCHGPLLFELDFYFSIAQATAVQPGQRVKGKGNVFIVCLVQNIVQYHNRNRIGPNYEKEDT